MSHPLLIEGPNRLEVRSAMRPGLRVALILLGIFPLIAPYELLVRIDWQDYLSPFFLLAAFISAGAVALSLLLFYAALTGISSRFVFDGTAATLTCVSESPLTGRNRRVYPLSSIAAIDVTEHDWSDGLPTYCLSITFDDGTVIDSGSSWSREEMETIRARVERFIAAGEA
ncbi:MAG TPA: hypothetical protein VF268_13190 [Gammaproteobacteria bacterium]|jgi:hypothetical protein